LLIVVISLIFEFRDEVKQLRSEFLAKTADPEAIAEIKGVHYSVFASFVNWKGSLSSPGELMHLLFLGA